MTGTSVRQRANRPARAGGAAFDLIDAKLMRPLVRPGTIRRPSLVERLRRDDGRPIVSVVAPAGYGKTTLLSQWAERNGQAFAWVTVDEGDNDARVLLSYVAEALNAVEPVGQRVFDALASPGSSVPGSVVPRLASAFSSMISPVVLVLDDVHLLHDSECRAALSVLADHVPGGSRLVLAGRDRPPLRVARLRAEGKIMEIGPTDLSLTRAEAAALLRAAEVTLGEDEVAELHRQTEGWPVGLYLAALSLREGGTPGQAVAAYGGDDRFVSEYLESELLARLSEQQRAFLTRTAVLDRMCGPLCETVLELPGSAATLAELARSNLLLVPLDRQGQWYRYHHLFRDMLLAKLQRQTPGLLPVLRRRAASWCLRNDLAEEALEYSIAAEDVDTAARLVEQLWLRVYQQARITTVQRWTGWLDDRGGIGSRPVAAAQAATLAITTGRPAEAERWADAVDRWQDGYADRPDDDPYTEGWAAFLRAYLCRHGVEQMRADADEAARQWAAANFVGPGGVVLQGVARVLCGDLDGGDAFLQDAISIFLQDAIREAGGPDVLATTYCERSLVAIARNQWSQAEARATEAAAVLRRARIEDCYATPLVCAVRARIAMHRGDVPAAHRELVNAQRLRHLLSYASPHVAVQARIEMIRVYLALSDAAGARTLMREIDEILKRRPDLGTLVGEARELRTRLAAERGPGTAGASTLTAAELRLLPLMSTHLQLQEIAAEMYLSPHIVRAQSKSIYRKLGASSRNEAITRARELGLMEG
jgi:LuxR family transcriptional regulator, maltose regulon positive regulatory protein